MNIYNSLPLIAFVLLNLNSRLVKSLGPEIKIVNVTANIKHHYAVTKLTVEYFNPSDEEDEVSFELAIPQTAFITGLDLYTEGRWSKARIVKKEDANNEYDEAKELGTTSGLVFHSKVRDAYGFEVAVYMESNEKATVVLTFEQLLSPINDQYSWTFFLILREDIPELTMNVNIKEEGNVKNIQPSIQHVNDVTKNKPIDKKYVTVKQPAKNEADVSMKIQKPGKILGNWNPEKHGMSMEFQLQYEIEPSSPSGVVLIDDNANFVHFLPAPKKASLSKHVIFVLDTSYSMKGRKLEQLKSAMSSILDRLSPKDYFNMIDYGSSATVRYLGHPFRDVRTHKVGRNYHVKSGSGIVEDMIYHLPNPFTASKTNINLAKQVISTLRPLGATNIYDSLKLAFHLAENSKYLPNDPEMIIIFLTDGIPTVGYKNLETIIDMTKDMNKGVKMVNLYTLGFGKDADQSFLRQISAVNSGFVTYIYEETDASEQIQELFDRVSTPVLSNVDFEYVVNDGKTTESKFNILYKGQELSVAGKLTNQKWNQQYSSNDFKVTAKSASGKQVFLPKVVRVFGQGLEKIQAYGKVLQLIEESIKRGDISKEALRLALQYGFVTPYTSLIVNDEVNNPLKVNSNSVSNRVRQRIGVLDELPWEVNQTIVIKDVEYNFGRKDTTLKGTDLECDVAKTGEVGECTLLWNCPTVYSKMTNLTMFERYFCVLEQDKQYAGVCCVFENED